MPAVVARCAGRGGPSSRQAPCACSPTRRTPFSWWWTFRLGGQIVTFERDGDAGPATVVRLDSGGGHYVLRRQPDPLRWVAWYPPDPDLN